ncbi:MAG: ATP-binding cassette domain-containing protein [Rhizobiaceae bacterium]|jgi:phosphonate transport system ATP-binding protein|nr:ATP-binding cassette domain-containing protein [Rhizobiaceae bacterium]
MSAAQANPALGVVPSHAIRLAGVAKTFGDVPVFSGIDLTINTGEAVAIIGSNGTGKSTLLRALNGLNPIDAGSVEVLGASVHALKGDALRRLRARIGFVFQKHFLVSRLCALSNVIHGMQARRSGPQVWAQWCAPAAAREEALACLQRVGLADKAMQRVDSLSGGQSQRVAIARMLMQRPEIILADEPAASLDPRAGDEVMELLFHLSREAGRTLVFVSHDMEHAVRYSDRIIGLSGGGIALDISATEARPQELTGFFAKPAAETADRPRAVYSGAAAA